MKSNKIPFTDLAGLVNVTTSKDADGYDVFAETSRQVFCSITQGVSRSEMYEALKAGIRLAATAEVWEDDYQREQFLTHENVRYKIIRVYPTGHGTLELSLEEVVR